MCLWSSAQRTFSLKCERGMCQSRGVSMAASACVFRATKADFGSALSGIASVYYDRMTASGERMNPNAMTAVHKTLQLGSRVTVVNHCNGRSATVRINDRGPYVR